MAMLTQKQEAFCIAYIELMNATEAYRRVYSAEKMKTSTMSRKSADLMNNGKITARIAELRDAVAKVAVVNEARVIEEAARIGFVDLGKMYDQQGKMLSIHDMPIEIRAAIASFEVKEIMLDGAVIGSETKVKLWDKNSALEKIMKHLGMFEKDNKQKSGAMDDLPHDTLRIIEEKLRGLRPVVAGDADTSGPGRFTH